MPEGGCRIVLVGAGHTHALVLERWARESLGTARLILVTDRTELLYSGMVPGLVAGDYEREDLIIDAMGLARRAGADVIEDRLVQVDASHRMLHLASGATLAYDVASLDIGSVPKAPPPSSRSRPVVSAKAAEDLRRLLQELGPRAVDGRTEIAVVGGGAAGVELAAACAARGFSVSLFEADERVLVQHDPRVSERAIRALRDRGVRVHTEVAWEGESQPTPGLVVWATGAAAPDLLRRSGLPVDSNGFVRVDSHLAVVEHPRLFAVGDCASLEGHDLPKGGVFAVRQAPILFDNLAATVAGMASGTNASLSRYDPQSNYLTLLNLGDGTALGTKWGYVVEGRWVRWLKDVIDRRFVERFRE